VEDVFPYPQPISKRHKKPPSPGLAAPAAIRRLASPKSIVASASNVRNVNRPCSYQRRSACLIAAVRVAAFPLVRFGHVDGLVHALLLCVVGVKLLPPALVRGMCLARR
jgi:hypothetical protein